MIQTKNIFWLFRPFAWLWNLIATIVMLTGRVLAVVLGLALMLLGVVLTITVVGAIAGIPMFIVGLLLAVRGLW
jgi:multisubunit Na+/H+ antiporter MnhC subunit